MPLSCSSRLVKNGRFLQSPEIAFIPPVEPLDGFSSLVPVSILSRLELLPLEQIGDERLVQAISRKRPPSAQVKLASPLFSGTLRFVQATFASSGTNLAVPDADLNVAMTYASLAIVPISEYCSQYGPNSLVLANTNVPFKASITKRKFNDGTLSGWVDEIAKANVYGSDTCLVFLSPQGIVNTDADPAQGVLGYHSVSSSGVPYAFVNVMGDGLTMDDKRGYYALALSHEIAEMTVDPLANGSNPEVSDECAGNCNVDYRNYFDAGKNWLGGNPTPGYYFFIDGIATPASVTQCPAPASSCSYPPPKSRNLSGTVQR
jgi:hypothetical protein